MEARPTIYRGIKMRSRLEAKEAAGLDAAGEGWKYEPNAFGSPKGQYLPDFEIVRPPGARRWFIEVKPPAWSPSEVRGRMEIVWASYPDAVLMIVSPREIHWNMGAGWKACPNIDGEVTEEADSPAAVDEEAAPSRAGDLLAKWAEITERHLGRQ